MMGYTQEQIDEALILAMGADQNEIERLRAEVLEQCRLNAMGAEREARLMAQLAEAQAREVQLRNEIASLELSNGEPGEQWYYFTTTSPEQLDALIQPVDHSALDALLRAERAKERERCAKVCESKHDMWKWDDAEDSASGPRDCAAAIRALGDD